MNLGLLLIIMFFQANNIMSQEMNIETAEKILGITIPVDYLKYRSEELNQEVEVYYRIENWLFWDLETAIDSTISMRNHGSISDSDFAFAINDENSFLIYQNAQKSSTKFSHIDEDNDVIFFGFSLTEFKNVDKTEQLIEEIETIGFENQDLTEIENCVGSLFNYAFDLNTSEYDENFSEERNKKALEIFFETADKKHPEAASAIADHYLFLEDKNIDKIIEWREKAIEYGNKEDIYELADFIIDEKISDIDRAIKLLESLLDEQWYKNRALLKLSRIYMKGTGGKLDYKKGIQYVEECSMSKNYNALSDLAFYYYKGKGVEKDVQKAYDLLVEAETIITRKTGSGLWEEFITKIEKELKKKE